MDLGSGIGKGVLTAGLMHEFDEVIGIEILEGLYQKSLELKEAYYAVMAKTLKQTDVRFNPFHYSSIPEMKLINGDFYDVRTSNNSLTSRVRTLCSATLLVLKTR